MSRFSIAMMLYAVLAVLALVTLSDEKFRLVTLAILALFAVRTLVHHRRAAMEKSSRSAGREGALSEAKGEREPAGETLSERSESKGLPR